MTTQNSILKQYIDGQWVPVVVGARGFTGSQGTTGFIGSQGIVGFTGSIGYTGSQGDVGFTGSQGNIGFTGSQGTTGFTGSVGFTGSQGGLGYTGSAGFTGSQGDTGFVGSQGALNPWAVKTTTYTAVDGDRLLANTSGGSFTINLPATPVTGAYVQISDGANFVTNNLTVGRNGSTIEGFSDDVLLDLAGATFEFIYSGTTWQVTATAGPQGPQGPIYGSRVVTVADGTSITMNANTTDMAVQANTQASGTLTINAPTGSPTDGQKLMLRISSTNVQTLSWNAIFIAGSDLGLPGSTSGASKTDYYGFIYDTVDTKWHLISNINGF